MLEKEKGLREKVSKEEYDRLSKKYQELEGTVSELQSGFKSLERFQKFYGRLLKGVDRVVGKQLEEEKKRIVQENKRIKAENEELKKEIKSLSEKRIQEGNNWKKKNEELKKEKMRYQAAEKNYRIYLTEHFLNLQETLWEMEEADKKYEEFFNDSVLPLQILMGLDREIDGQTQERVHYYIWDVIIEPLVGVMKKREGTLVNGRLVLPKSSVLFEREQMVKKIAQESLDNLERYIKEDERRVELKSIVLQKKQVVEELGRMLAELKEIVGEHKIEKREIHRLAEEVRFLLERNEIYPLFAEELKKYSDSELKGRMIPVNSNSIKYPGLFIKKNGGLEVLGTNIGMDDYGREDSESD